MTRLMSRLVGAKALDDKASADWTTYDTFLTIARIDLECSDNRAIRRLDNLRYGALMSEYIYKERTERNLPHFHPPGATLFVTFRLAGTVYRLDAYCIMSNHVHAVFAPFLSAEGLRQVLLPEGLRFISKHPPLDRIMKSLKGYSAWEANGAIGRRGAFWQRE